MTTDVTQAIRALASALGEQGATLTEVAATGAPRPALAVETASGRVMLRVGPEYDPGEPLLTAEELQAIAAVSAPTERTSTSPPAREYDAAMIPPSLQRKMDFAQKLLRKARAMMPADIGVTIIVHKADLLEGGGLETAVVTTLNSREKQRVAICEALYQSGLATGADDPLAMVLGDLEAVELGRRS